MPDQAPVIAVDPEVVPVFVDDENLGWNPRRQGPFPLGHQRLARADNAEKRVAVLAEFAVKLAPEFAPAIIGDAIEPRGFGTESLGKRGIAGDQVEPDIVTPDVPQAGKEALQKMSRPALHEEDGMDRRIAASEDVSHYSEFSANGLREALC